MNVEITFYGGLREKMGARRIDLELDSEQVSVKRVLDRLQDQYNGFGESVRRTVACSIGDKIVNEKAAVSDGDNIALLPPVSGG